MNATRSFALSKRAILARGSPQASLGQVRRFQRDVEVASKTVASTVNITYIYGINHKRNKLKGDKRLVFQSLSSIMFYRSFKLLAMSLMLALNFAEAQNENSVSSLLSGVLLDHDTRKPVPYASIVIDGSNVGTSSSETGMFYLGLNAEGLEYLTISSIGYSTLHLRIDSLQRIESLVIYVKPFIIRLDEVLVQANRFSASDFVREAIHSLDKNSYQKDYRLEWYSTIVSMDSATNTNYCLETIFDVYHMGGKERRTIRQQRETGISPLVVENPKDTLCALSPFFELGIAEIENALFGVFILENIDDFAFTYEGVLGLDQDSVYVIAYEATSHRYKVVGSTNKRSTFNGKLYINTRSHAILRHTLETGEKRFINYEVLYKKIDSYYFPYYVKCTKHLNFSKNYKPSYSNTYILRNVRLDDVEYKPGYNWCDNRAPYNEDFWNSNYPRK